MAQRKPKVFGYARVSTSKQRIGRQVENILREAPSAVIYQEAFTGTTLDRPQWKKLMRAARPGDTIIFDEVSRMSRDAQEGFKTYTELYQKGVQLVFLKEPHINTAVYQKALEAKIEGVGNEIADIYIEATNKVLEVLQRQQIELAFQTAQKEVDYLHKRISEGVRRAQANGEQVGREEGVKIETKKAKEKKQEILKHSKDFGGTLNDAECMKLTGLARNTFYKYKRELKA